MTAPQPPREYPGMPGHVPPEPTPPQATPKQKHTVRWILMGCGAAFVVLLGLTVSTHPSSPSPTPATPQQAGVDTSSPAAAPPAPVTTEAPPAVRHVVYTISGTTKSAGTVTYNADGGGSIQQEQDVAVPWSKAFDLPAHGFGVLTISAQNAGGGAITCTITVDGRTLKTATSNGQYAIASCSDSIH